MGLVGISESNDSIVRDKNEVNDATKKSCFEIALLLSAILKDRCL